MLALSLALQDIFLIINHDFFSLKWNKLRVYFFVSLYILLWSYYTLVQIR